MKLPQAKKKPFNLALESNHNPLISSISLIEAGIVKH